MGISSMTSHSVKKEAVRNFYYNKNVKKCTPKYVIDDVLERAGYYLQPWAS